MSDLDCSGLMHIIRRALVDREYAVPLYRRLVWLEYLWRSKLGSCIHNPARNPEEADA